MDTLLTLLQVYSDRKRESLGRLRRGMAAQRALATSEKETVAQVLRSSEFTGDEAKGIVWAHNSHLGQSGNYGGSVRSVAGGLRLHR